MSASHDLDDPAPASPSDATSPNDVAPPDGVAPPNDVTRGVLLIGHGTRDELGTRQFFDLGERLAERVDPLPVQAALLEFQRPTIEEAWESLVAGGIRHIHVAPLLLFAAGHAKEDIPSVIRECQAKTPDVTFDQSRPLSRQPSMVDLVLRRVTNAIEASNTSPERLAVVMVGRGSHDPCAQADMRVLSEVIGRQLTAKSTVTAFYAMASPSLPQVLDDVAACGRFDEIVVYPHLLFAGRLYEAIVRQTHEAAERHAAIQFSTAPYLGPDILVADAIAARINQCRATSMTASATNRSSY